MSSVNKVILIGNLGKDPEIRSLNSGGDKVANFSVATSERWKDKQTGEKREKTDWHNVVVFGGLVQVCERYLRKGSKVYLEGKLQTRKWTDQQGQDKYTTEVVLTGFQGNLVMLDGKPEGGRDEYAERGGSSRDDRPAEDFRREDLDDEIPF